MEILVVGEGFLNLREVAKIIEKSTSFAQLLRKWRLFGEELNLKDDVIEDLQKRMDNGTYELSDLPRQILKRWKASQGTEATLQKLCEALEDCGVLNIADALEAKFGKTNSVEEPLFLLQNRVHTIQQLLGPNASEEFIQQIHEKYKLTADIPIPLLKEDVLPKKLPDYYISRTFLSRTELNEQIFTDKSTKEHIFVVKGATKSDLARVSGFQMIESTRSQLEKLTVRFIILDQDKDYEKISKLSSAPVHLIAFKNSRFFWLNSTQGLDVIKPFLKKIATPIETNEDADLFGDDTYEEHWFVGGQETGDFSYIHSENSFGEDEAAEKIMSQEFPSVFSIAESPGMGKTVILNSLALKIYEGNTKAVIIFLVLQEFIKQIFSTKLTSPDLDCILKYVTTDYHRMLILQNMLQTNLYKFYIFLDGYDEVFQENLDFVDTLLLTLMQTQNVKIIVTTRRHLTSRVENILKTLAFELLPFGLSNQIVFLTRYWVTKHGAKDGRNLQVFAKKCLSSLQKKMTDKERKIAGIPLLCLMLAEVYADKTRQAAKLEEQSMHSVLVEEPSFFHLYKSLIYLRLTRIPDSHTRQKYLDAHVHRAITLLFPDFLEKFIPLLTPQDDIEETTLFSIGLIEKSPFSSAPRFVHRTFAEYIFADFMCRDIYKNETCVEFLIQQILGKSGIMEENDYLAAYPYFRLKNQVIAYFLNTSLQERIVNTPNALNSLKLKNVSAENVCIAAYTCCCNNLESGFNLMADVISHFNIKDQEDLKDKYIKWLLHLAVQYSNSVSFVQSVLNFTKFVFGANLTHNWQQKDFSFALGLNTTNDTPLHIAVRKGKYNIVMYLLQEYGEEVLSFKQLPHTCVRGSVINSESVIEEKVLIIEALIQRNREWLEEKLDGRTPLLESLVHARMADHLLALGANINAHSTKHGTVLHTANGSIPYTDLVRWALGHGFHCVNHKDVDGKTPFMRAIEMYNTVDDEVLQLLYDAGADFNEQDNQGVSVLFYAIQYSDSPFFIEKIMDFGANLNHVDREGRNAAHFLLFPSGSLNYLDRIPNLSLFLLSSHKNLNKKVKMEIIKLLKSRGFNGFNDKDYYGRTPIMAHLKSELTGYTIDDEIFNFLQKEGVDFNAQDNNGNSVLLYAIEFSKNFHFIQKLLDLGANPNQRGEVGRNAAHIVLECYNDTILAEKVLKLLKLRGFIGFNDKDLNGNTALMLALDRNISGDLLKFICEETSECSGQKRKLLDILEA